MIITGNNVKNFIKRIFNNSSYKSFVNNFIHLVLITGINLLLQYITSPYLVCILRIEHFGLIYFGTSNRI